MSRRKFVEAIQNAHEVRDLLRQTVTSTNAWGAAVMLPDKSCGVLDCVTNVGLPEDWAHITNALNETTGNGRCYLSGKPVLIQGVPIGQPDGATTEHFMSAIVVVPLKQRNSIVGTLEVIKDKPGGTFTPKEVVILQNFADNLVDTGHFKYLENL